jgi:hypothetical protein
VSSRGVVVLGMHRSGTSAAARVVNLLGVPLLSGDLLPPDDANPRGYWESEALRRFDDELLLAIGGTWSRPPASPEWALANGLRERARSSFGAAFRGEWLWKDPRASVTLPFWLSTFGFSPAVVLVHRDPREVAASLERRDGFSPRRSLALWERYVRSGLEVATGLPAFVTGYSELVDDPEGWSHRVAEFLRSQGFSVSGARPGEVAAFVDADLRRSVALDAELSEEQKTLWRRLERLEGAHAALAPGELGTETPWAEDVLVAGELADLRARADALEAERDELLGSRVYRWSAPARRAADAVLRLAGRA